MTVEHLEILVEDRSTEAALQLLLPRIVGISFQIHAFQGKHHLLKRLPNRLEGYATWLPSSSRVIVIIDRDNDPCLKLKARLEAMARAAGLVTRSSAGRGQRFTVVNRLAIEELEAWFFGDWNPR